jgi:hypothetical protein
MSRGDVLEQGAPQKGRTPLGCLWVAIALLLFGLPVAWSVCSDLIDAYRVKNVYREAQCAIVEARVETTRDTTQSTRSKSVWFHPKFTVRYSLDGATQLAHGFSLKNYEDSIGGDEIDGIMARYPKGAVVPCYYDPAQPSRMVLTREFGKRSRLFILIPTLGAVLIAVLILVVLLHDYGVRGIARGVTAQFAVAPPKVRWALFLIAAFLVLMLVLNLVIRFAS